MGDRLILVRHVHVDLVDGLASSEWPASEEGLSDARRLAAAPVFRDLARIASSPEPKALATARPIAEAAGLEVVVEPALREVARPPGPIVSSAEVARRVRAYLDGELDDDWEPRAAARGRIASCVERLRDACDGPLAVVSHGLILTLFRADGTAVWQEMPLPAVAIADGAGVGPWLSLEQVLAGEGTSGEQ